MDATCMNMFTYTYTRPKINSNKAINSVAHAKPAKEQFILQREMQSNDIANAQD